MSGRPAVLLDRDGTLIVERGYLGDPLLVELERGAADGLRALASAGFLLAVVTNQSGIARGYFGRDEVDAVNARVAALLAAEGICIAGWFVCPHHPSEACFCRKPRPGLALEAAARLGVDLSRSWVVGDRLSDVEMADAVGAQGMLMLTGHGPADADRALAAGYPVATTLGEAAGLIAAIGPREAVHAIGEDGTELSICVDDRSARSPIFTITA